VLRPDYPIETARLTLRPWRDDDFDALYAIQSRPDVARYLYWSPRDADGVREALAVRVARTEVAEAGQGLSLAVVWRDAGRVVGDVNLQWLSSEHRNGEIGFVFNPEFHGHGLATEAARAMLAVAFDGLGLHRVVGRLDARNIASARVLERLGMRREAHFVENEYVKGEWVSELVYAMLASEWHTR
jgi:RimJ/RimL family protein N-acetyltransferase